LKTLQLSLEETFNEEFHLIAIYSTEEDYRMAFLLNQFLDLKLIKTPSIITPNNHAQYSVFEYNDENLYRFWQLIYNHSTIKKEVKASYDLFSRETESYDKSVFYIKELQKAAFFLKITADEKKRYYNYIVKKIKKIPQVYTCELLSLDKIKERQKLLI